ncbi:hypothetical protein N9878_01080 [bacterium]|nr:hypothetical protein [bacterium]
MSEYKEKKVGMSEITYKKLLELSITRELRGSLIHRNKDIFAQMVNDAHKKECK